jgi:hypothetical protein
MSRHPKTYWTVLWSILLLLALKSECLAQLPFYTDDADTTPKGKFHLEISNEHDLLQKSAYPTKRQNTLVFTLNYGLTNKLELGINAPLLTLINSKTVSPRNVDGIGDTQFGMKYNFLAEREGSKRPAMALVFYVEAPTGNTQKQLGSGLVDYWLYGVIQKSFTKKTKGRLNGGVLFSGNNSTGLIGIETQRGHIYTGDGSIVRDITDRLQLGVEVFGAVTGSFVLNKGQLTTQFGGDYALTKKLTMTFGLLAGKFASSPRVGGQVGFTYDF